MYDREDLLDISEWAITHKTFLNRKMNFKINKLIIVSYMQFDFNQTYCAISWMKITLALMSQFALVKWLWITHTR